MGSLFTSSYRFDPQGVNYGQGVQQAQTQQAQNMAQQQALAQALQAQMSGAGPSVAQQALKQATNRNIQQNTAMIASQKGINPALAQKLAAQNAAAMGQEAAAQGATLQAQEQLAARGQLGGLYGQMGQQNLTAQSQYLQGVQGQNQINAGIEAQNAANMAGLAGGVINAAGSALTAGLGGAKTAPMGGSGGGAGGGSRTVQGMMTPMSEGGKVDGKAKVKGDSEKNDTVPAMLSPGEIVIPRSHSDSPEKAKEFIDHLMKGHKKEEDSEEMSYGKVLEAHRKLQERVKALESKGKK